jgi:hypothetical protein
MAMYRARMVREPDGSWTAAAVEFPNTWSRGKSRDEALAKLRDEIRYRIELCPCSGVADDFVQIEVAGERPRDEARTHAAAPPGAAHAGEAAAPNVPATWVAARPAVPATFQGTAGCPSWKRPRE